MMYETLELLIQIMSYSLLRVNNNNKLKKNKYWVNLFKLKINTYKIID